MPDNINHPAHYNANGIECIDVIRAALGDDGCKAFCIGNALKYLYRARYKGKENEDIAKANWYLAKWLELDKEKTEPERGCPFDETYEVHMRKVTAHVATPEELEQLKQNGGVVIKPLKRTKFDIHTKSREATACLIADLLDNRTDICDECEYNNTGQPCKNLYCYETALKYLSMEATDEDN